MEVRSTYAKALDGAAVGELIRATWNDEGQRLSSPLLFEDVGHRGAPKEWLPRICETAGISTVEYVGGNSPRTKLADAVYTSTEYPQKETLSLHQELSYETRVPEVLVFICVTAPSIGGETSVCDAGELLSGLPDDLTDRFDELGLRYRQLLPAGERRPGRTWMAQFQTESRSECERHLDGRSLRYRWEPDGSLRIERDRQAIRNHPRTGLPLWFNQADQWDIGMSMDRHQLSVFTRFFGPDAAPHTVTYMDGTSIDIDDLRLIKQTAIRLSEKPRWAVGNVLVIDNRQHMHGRMPFGGNRRILVSMGDFGGAE
ncbi:TauD/TfdA family dioxygenase [Streptomyces sp. NPDC127117]|uniref:TauD/TfdA family dioxygenase n=1 Tax=Streptomyces sp. NPDC127117 TaxID=3345368 RepID=UPI003636A2A4